MITCNVISWAMVKPAPDKANISSEVCVCVCMVPCSYQVTPNYKSALYTVSVRGMTPVVDV